MMKEERLAHYYNCIKMCQSEKAINGVIERIFNEGNLNGWDEAGQCPQCFKQLPQVQIDCPHCMPNGELIPPEVPPTEKQLQLMMNLGIELPRELTRKEAIILIKEKLEEKAKENTPNNEQELYDEENKYL